MNSCKYCGKEFPLKTSRKRFLDDLQESLFRKHEEDCRREIERRKQLEDEQSKQERIENNAISALGEGFGLFESEQAAAIVKAIKIMINREEY